MSYPNEIERQILSITNITTSYWGYTLTIEGFRESVEMLQCTVKYTNCKLIQWESVEDGREDVFSSVTDVIGWELGEGDYKKPAIVTTNLFELIVWYQQYETSEFVKELSK